MENEMKRFAQDIDRIVAGEEVQVGDGVSDDYRTTLEFAQKLTGLRDAPSPSFQAQLKAILLQRLGEGVTSEGKGGWLKRLVLKSLVWRAVATTAVVVILIAVGAVWYWGVPGAPPPAPRPPSTIPRPVEFIEIKATTEKSIYLPGENIVIEFSFKNVSQKTFRIAPFPPDIRITHPGHGQDELICLFPAGNETKTLEPGEVTSYAITWDQRDSQGQPVDYGYYEFRSPDIGAQDEVFVPVGGVFIHPPEGVIEKTIEVNQSQTVNDISFTLERVELTARGPRFYAFNADYRDPKRPPKLKTICGEYSLDGGPVVEADSVTAVGGGSNLDGYEYVWFMSRPIPKNTRELTFVITSFGDWEGPWVFRVPLE